MARGRGATRQRRPASARFAGEAVRRASQSARGSLAVVLVALAPSACGSPDETTDPKPAQHVVLGTGEAEFEPIDGEPRLRLVAGIQGGFHAWASFLAYGFETDQLDMVLETRVEDDPETSIVMRARPTFRPIVDASGEPVQSFAGFPAQVYDARCAQDKRVRVEVTLTDPDRTSASDTLHYVADVPEQQRRTDCDQP